MSKKTLLNENTIRRFWKLASIRPINEMEYLRDEEEEEGLPEPAMDEPPNKVFFSTFKLGEP